MIAIDQQQGFGLTAIDWQWRRVENRQSVGHSSACLQLMISLAIEFELAIEIELCLVEPHRYHQQLQLQLQVRDLVAAALAPIMIRRLQLIDDSES